MIDQENEATAWKVWQGFAQGCASGEWNNLLALIAEDVVFFFPSGPFQGENHGRERFRQYTQYVSETLHARLVFEEPLRATSAGPCFVFEAWDEGTVAGQSVRNRIALSLDIEQGKVAGMREYMGVTR